MKQNIIVYPYTYIWLVFWVYIYPKFICKNPKTLAARCIALLEGGIFQNGHAQTAFCRVDKQNKNMY
jgi:hypothetical protein